MIARIPRTLYALHLAILLAAGCENGAPVDGAGGSGGCDEIRARCLPLDEAECEQDPECQPIRGAVWEGNTEECLAKPAEFLECAGCLTGYDAGGCVYRESDPQRCYCMPSTITMPGWVDVFECEPPEGVCGMHDGGVGGEECRGPLEDYCSPCAMYEEAFADAFEGFDICSGDGPTNTLPAAGTCGEFRWIETWDVADQFFEYFDASGTMVGAIFETDFHALCDGSSFSKDYGLVPDCERVKTVRACDPQ